MKFECILIEVVKGQSDVHSLAGRRISSVVRMNRKTKLMPQTVVNVKREKYPELSAHGLYLVSPSDFGVLIMNLD